MEGPCSRWLPGLCRSDGSAGAVPVRSGPAPDRSRANSPSAPLTLDSGLVQAPEAFRSRPVSAGPTQSCPNPGRRRAPPAAGRGLACLPPLLKALRFKGASEEMKGVFHVFGDLRDLERSVPQRAIRMESAEQAWTKAAGAPASPAHARARRRPLQAKPRARPALTRFAARQPRRFPLALHHALNACNLGENRRRGFA